MDRYKKKTVEVEAVQLTQQNIQAVALWSGGYIVDEFETLDGEGAKFALNVPTHEGTQRVSDGMYVGRRDGILFVCSQQAFEHDFEKA